MAGLFADFAFTKSGLSRGNGRHLPGGCDGNRRIPVYDDIHHGWLIGRFFFVRLFGYAAKPIADRLQKRGGVLVVPPEGFYVEGTEGPLQEGELERASEWARRIVAQV